MRPIVDVKLQIENMALTSPQPPTKVYVIIRVYDLTTNVDLKIYVDPLRLDGNEITFEVQGYTERTR